MEGSPCLSCRTG